jgi:hypothetical protein
MRRPTVLSLPTQLVFPALALALALALAIKQHLFREQAGMFDLHQE